MKRNFRTYNLALEFYRVLSPLKLPHHLKGQLLRAASSIALNLAEGQSRRSAREQRRFYEIAMGSLRECQAIFDLSRGGISRRIFLVADSLAACLWKLIKSREPNP